MEKNEKNNALSCRGIQLEHDNEITFIHQNTIAQKLFEFLCREKNLTEENLILCSGEGLVLASFPQTMQTIQNVHLAKEQSVDFAILTDPNSEQKENLEALQTSFSELMLLFIHNERIREFIFQGLDALPNSIHICDKDLRMVYANSDFCRYMHLQDREKAYGRPIEDIMQDIGVKFIAAKGHRENLKAKEVLQYGKPVIDWEVEVVSTASPNDYMLASNDMYPLFDAAGKVSGVAEISRSRTTQIKQVQNALGLSADYTFDDIIGSSRPMIEAKKLAMSFASSPYNILIYGESGVGKELFAQSIHNYSPRRNKPFVAINCANISPELIDSELFGYESGAFTGASKSGQIGKFELANGGTLFLDEVAELPLHFQTKLLRALETRQITKVGGTKNISVDVRIIAATNRSLENMIEEGLFREDLYYRLMVLNITIPPLREHAEDILTCSDFFLKQASRINNLQSKVLDDEAKELMLQYEWPGNIRELRNVMNRVCVLSDSDVITRETLLASLKAGRFRSEALALNRTAEERLEEKRQAIALSNAALIKEALDIAKGSRTEAAKLLDVSRKTFYNMLEKYQKYLD
mgnify:FL=1